MKSLIRIIGDRLKKYAIELPNPMKSAAYKFDTYADMIEIGSGFQRKIDYKLLTSE
jgi:hypothetical protein